MGLRDPSAPPADPVPFVGRGAEIAKLTDRLVRSMPSPPALVLYGPAGVGKSAIAAGLARELAGQLRLPVAWVAFPSGITYAAELTLLRLLGMLGGSHRDALSLQDTDPHLVLERLLALCREHLSAHPAVVVLDDVPSPAGAATVLRALRGTGSVVIMTSRTASVGPLTSLSQVVCHAVRPLTPADSVKLVRAAAVRRGHLKRGEPDPTDRALADASLRLPVHLRLAGTLSASSRDAFMRLPAEDRRSPEAPFRLAWEQLGDPLRAALAEVATLPAQEFSAHYAEALGMLGPGRSWAKLDELARRKFVQKLRPGVFRLHPALRDLVAARPPSEPGREPRVMFEAAVHEVRRLRGRLAMATEGGISSASLVANRMAAIVDDVTDLAARTAETETAGIPDLLTQLAAFLSLRGDRHRLMALHQIAQRAADRSFRDELRMHLAVAERETGRAAEAANAFQRLSHPLAPFQLAVTLRHLGRLTESLDVLSASDCRPGQVDLLQSCILTDQGRLAKAEAGLDAPDDETNNHTAWRMLFQARWCLLQGKHDPAARWLGLAQMTFFTMGDARGLAWTRTEVGRMRLLAGDRDRAVTAFLDALALHRDTDDLRGEAWTHYHLAVARGDAGQSLRARQEMRTAHQLFQQVKDSLGTAWALHHLAVLQELDGVQQTQLELAAWQFERAGCLHGLAWSALELGLIAARWAGRSAQQGLDPGPYVRVAEAHFDAADGLFARVGDACGALWARFARTALPDGTAGEATEALRQLASKGFPSSPDAQAMLKSGIRAGRPNSVHLRARATISVVSADAKWAAEWFASRTDPDRPPAAEGPECRVRLTLLDDASGPARILLRVEPHTGHPWAAAAGREPWLKVVATPLTHAEVEPATALVRPSAADAHGAEFRLTPQRPGLHRLRFTVLHDPTEVVLQQVETEIDIIDSRPERLLAAPHPHHAGEA